MIYHSALVLLGPLLYVQGKLVRRFTPQLDEPVGERAGQRGEGEPLQLLIAGDSAAAGMGVDHQQQALSGSLVSALSSRRAVSWQLLAKSGDASSQLLDKLLQEPAEAFETVVISIGVNDVIAMVKSAHWVDNLHQLVDLLQGKFAAQRIYFSSIPPMQLFPALPNPLGWWLGLRARQFNALMREVAEQRDGCQFVLIPYPADRSYIAVDGFHPGPPAYQLWGKHIAEIIDSGPAVQ